MSTHQGKPRKLATRILLGVVRKDIQGFKIGCGAEYVSLASEVANKEPGRMIFSLICFYA